MLGVLADDRLAAESLAAGDLIPIDVVVLQQALPASVREAQPGAPRIRAVAAYYAPQTDFALSGSFRRTAARIDVTSNLLFRLSEQQLRLRGGFAILPMVEKLFAVDIAVPAGWRVTEVTKDDGTPLPFKLMSANDGAARVQVRLSSGAPPARPFNVFVLAISTPAGWLNDWSQRTVELPRFQVLGASRDHGALAIQVEGDLVARPSQLNNLTPLDEKELAEFGFVETVSGLAYRYDAQPYGATLSIERHVPRVTARTFSFLRIEPEGMTAHYEVHYHAEQARVRRLEFELPATTPATIAIRGIDVPVKEFRSDVVDGIRRWTADLAEAKAGTIRLAVDFQQELSSDQPRGLDLPLIRGRRGLSVGYEPPWKEVLNSMCSCKRPPGRSTLANWSMRSIRRESGCWASTVSSEIHCRSKPTFSAGPSMGCPRQSSSERNWSRTYRTRDEVKPRRRVSAAPRTRRFSNCCCRRTPGSGR